MQSASPYYINSPESKIALQFMFPSVPYIEGLTTCIQKSEDTIKKYLNIQEHVEIESKYGFFSAKDDTSYKTLATYQKLTLLEIKKKGGKSPYLFNAKIPETIFQLIKRSLDDRSTHSDNQMKYIGYFNIRDKMYNKARVSEIYDSTNKLIATEIISKINRTDINVYNFANDFRITLSQEKPMPLPSSTERVNFSRNKHRFRYRYQFMEFDLTRVEEKNGIELEIEIEIVDVAFFANQLKSIANDESLVKPNDSNSDKIKEGIQAKRFNLSKFITQYFYNIASIAKLTECPQLAYDYFFIKLYGPEKPIIGQYMIEEHFSQEEKNKKETS